MDERTEHILTILEQDGRQLHLLLARLTLREDAADDLMQELFIRLRRSDNLFTATNPRAYVKRAAIHLAFDWRRHWQRRIDVQQLPLESAANAVSLLDTLVGREEVEEILAALEHIPEVYRDCLLLRYLQQEEYDAIGKQIGKTPHQVRAICHKAIARIRKLLDVTTAGKQGEIHDSR